MQHLKLEYPLLLEVWQATVRGAAPATSFHTYASAFRRAIPCGITAELKQIIDDFGDRRLGASAPRTRSANDTIEAVWIDAFHNYVAVVFTKASGDPEDALLTMSVFPKGPGPQAIPGTA